MNEDAIGRLNSLLSLEDNLRKHPNLKQIHRLIVDEITAYENDPTLLGGEDKPKPTHNPAAQFPPKTAGNDAVKVNPKSMNEIPNDPADSPVGQPNRRA